MRVQDTMRICSEKIIKITLRNYTKKLYSSFELHNINIKTTIHIPKLIENVTLLQITEQ